MDPPSDQDLAVRAQRGQAEAYGELVQRHQTSVFNVCYRMMGNRQEAEDMSQEAFLRAYDRLSTFDPARPFGPWIRKVAANFCLNRLAAGGPVLLPLEDERETRRGARPRQVELAVEASDRDREIRGALMQLSPQYRAVIELRHFQELSYNQIAQVLRLSLPQVKSYLFRARKQLGEMLKRDE